MVSDYVLTKAVFRQYFYIFYTNVIFMFQGYYKCNPQLVAHVQDHLILATENLLLQHILICTILNSLEK